ncbi:MAG: damage-inducible protein DinB [Treponema sp.]|jgi:uncharacterized damage-inducible protein DinB|nr:damage-inducible protein DinB [Treponema sp.]
MKDVLLIQAKYMQEADREVYALLDALSNEQREAERGSYYGSLSGLARHILGGTVFFHSLFKTALENFPGSSAAKVLSCPPVSVPKDTLTAEQWKALGSAFETADSATVDFAAALEDAELTAPVKVDWYGGNPASVPLYFMFTNLAAHGIHHRGQISQILDEMKVDNDYSGINAAFLPK